MRGEELSASALGAVTSDPPRLMVNRCPAKYNKFQSTPRARARGDSKLCPTWDKVLYFKPRLAHTTRLRADAEEEEAARE
jgi:hypothetical protein